jgi:hypothetical protein
MAAVRSTEAISKGITAGPKSSRPTDSMVPKPRRVGDALGAQVDHHAGEEDPRRDHGRRPDAAREPARGRRRASRRRAEQHDHEDEEHHHGADVDDELHRHQEVRERLM